MPRGICYNKGMQQPDSDRIERCIERSNAGDEEARRELFDLVYDRMQRVASKMLRAFPGVRRWEQTDDLWQNAGMKLWKSLARVPIRDTRHFHNLAALHIRRELIDLTRRHFGPQGLGANQASRDISPGDPAQRPLAPEGQTDTFEAGHLAVWTEFHQRVEQLPSEEREVFDLLWYQGLSQAEAATLIGVSERTVKRRWQQARLQLARELNCRLPE